MGRVARLPGTGVKLSIAKKWVGAVAAITVTAALAVTAFVVHVSGSYGRLRWAGSSTSQSMDSAHAGPAGTTWVFGSYNPCVTANPVTVTGIKFTKSSGLAMTGWGHKINRGRGIGSARGTVTKNGFQAGAAQVTLPCSSVRDPNPRTGACCSSLSSTARQGLPGGLMGSASPTGRTAAPTPRAGRWALPCVAARHCRPVSCLQTCVRPSCGSGTRLFSVRWRLRLTTGPGCLNGRRPRLRNCAGLGRGCEPGALRRRAAAPTVQRGADPRGEPGRVGYLGPIPANDDQSGPFE